MSWSCACVTHHDSPQQLALWHRAMLGKYLLTEYYQSNYVSAAVLSWCQLQGKYLLHFKSCSISITSRHLLPYLSIAQDSLQKLQRGGSRTMDPRLAVSVSPTSKKSKPSVPTPDPLNQEVGGGPSSLCVHKPSRASDA